MRKPLLFFPHFSLVNSPKRRKSHERDDETEGIKASKWGEKGGNVREPSTASSIHMLPCSFRRVLHVSLPSFPS